MDRVLDYEVVRSAGGNTIYVCEDCRNGECETEHRSSMTYTSDLHGLCIRASFEHDLSPRIVRSSSSRKSTLDFSSSAPHPDPETQTGRVIVTQQ